jgi:hypothetical protein
MMDMTPGPWTCESQRRLNALFCALQAREIPVLFVTPAWGARDADGGFETPHLRIARPCGDLRVMDTGPLYVNDGTLVQVCEADPHGRWWHMTYVYGETGDALTDRVVACLAVIAEQDADGAARKAEGERT